MQENLKCYLGTDKFGHVDVLSRLINQHVRLNEDYVIAALTLENDVGLTAFDSLKVFPLHFKEVQLGTQNNEVLSKVVQYIHQGWPAKQTIASNGELQQFYNRRESLTTVHGCVLFGERLVLPAQLRKRCLNQLHVGHPGMGRMKAIARSYVYWPAIDAEIEQTVKECSQCALAAKSSPRLAPVPWPKTERPWQRVHIDYAGPVDGEYFLLLMDSFSKWPEIVQTNRITTTATIKILRNLFARLGMPELLVSDNGTQFKSAEFAQFCILNGIQHITTAPFHPQSNGLVERLVDTFKRGIKKIQEGKGPLQEALDLFLLTYRSTPNPLAPNGVSPSEALIGRRIRTNLDLLRPPADHQQILKKENQNESRRYFNKGESVYAKIYSRNTWSWVPGTIVERIGSVMYNVETEKRRLVRSHMNQLRSRSSPSADSAFRKPKKVNSNPLPLDVLLDAWKLPSNPAATQSGVADRHIPSLSPPLPTVPANPVRPENLGELISTIVPTSQQSTLASTPLVHQPRRSLRTRRAPSRLNVYHRY